MGSVNTCRYPFSVLAGLGYVLSSHIEIHFVSWLAWKGFGQHMLRCIFSSSRVKIHSMFTLAYDGFSQHMLRWILFIPWHRIGLINTIWETFCVLAGIGWLWSTNWDASCVFPGMGGVWSTYVEMHFISSMTWDGFGQRMLRYILCPRWHGTGLVN